VAQDHLAVAGHQSRRYSVHWCQMPIG
jgi:hypothetical protein